MSHSFCGDMKGLHKMLSASLLHQVPKATDPLSSQGVAKVTKVTSSLSIIYSLSFMQQMHQEFLGSNQTGVCSSLVEIGHSIRTSSCSVVPLGEKVPQLCIQEPAAYAIQDGGQGFKYHLRNCHSILISRWKILIAEIRSAQQQPS